MSNIKDMEISRLQGKVNEYKDRLGEWHATHGGITLKIEIARLQSENKRLREENAKLTVASDRLKFALELISKI